MPKLTKKKKQSLKDEIYYLQTERLNCLKDARDMERQIKELNCILQGG